MDILPLCVGAHSIEYYVRRLAELAVVTRSEGYPTGGWHPIAGGYPIHSIHRLVDINPSAAGIAPMG